MSEWRLKCEFINGMSSGDSSTKCLKRGAHWPLWCVRRPGVCVKNRGKPPTENNDIGVEFLEKCTHKHNPFRSESEDTHGEIIYCLDRHIFIY